MSTAETITTSAAGYVIQGRDVTFPVVVREATSGAATYLVDAAVARRMLDAPDLDVVELLPGRALLSVACIDYVDNDLGDYNEVSLAFFVRERSAPRGIPYVSALADILRGRVSTFIFWLPVDQAFTREAGERIWGFPKTVETIDFDRTGERAVCRLESGGRHVLTLSMRRGGRTHLPASDLHTYTRIAGHTHRTRFVSESEGVGFGFFGGADIELGDHEMSDKLRELGLPARPLMSVWMEHMHARFDAAVAL